MNRSLKGKKIGWICLLAALTLSAGGCAGRDGPGGQETVPAGETSAQETAEGTPEEKENILDVWKEELPQETEAEILAEAVRGLRVVKDGEELFAVAYDPKPYKNTYECWDISVPYRSLVMADTEYLYTYFKNLEGLQADAAEKETAQAPDGETLQDTGLAQSRSYLFAAYYKEQQKEQPGPPAPDAAVTYRIGNPDGAGHYYIQAGEDGPVFLAPAEQIDGLYGINAYESILKVAGLVGLDTVSEVSAEADGEEYVLRVQKDGCYIGERRAEKEEFTQLYSSLLGIYLEGELPREGGSGGEKKPLLAVTYKRNTPEAPEIRQIYYEYDERYASVSINGHEFFLVDKAAVEEVKAGIRAAFMQGQ